ncbi:MAG: DUF397 domain-containing protein [Actinoallomurus sp.]
MAIHENEPKPLSWRKSLRSGDASNCVEVAVVESSNQ